MAERGRNQRVCVCVAFIKGGRRAPHRSMWILILVLIRERGVR